MAKKSSTAKKTTSPQAGPKAATSKALSTLNQSEQKELTECRAIIQKGFHTFLEVGQALVSIQQKKLYRASHDTFEAFCRDEFDMGRSYAYRLIESAKVIEDLSPIGDKAPLPSNESQVRILAALPTPDLRRSAWQKVIDVSDEKSASITAKLVRAVIKKSVGENGKQPPAPKRKRLTAAVVIRRVESFAVRMEKLLKSGKTAEAMSLLATLKEELPTAVSDE